METFPHALGGADMPDCGTSAPPVIYEQLRGTFASLRMGGFPIFQTFSDSRRGKCARLRSFSGGERR